MIWNKSLTFRLWLTMNILVLLGVFMISSIFIVKETDHLENALRNEGIAAANTLSSAISLSMLKENYSEISPISYAVLDHPDIKYVIIRNKDGTIVNKKGDSVTPSNNNILVEKIPITYFQKQIGEIEVGIFTDEFHNQIKSLYLSTILTGIIVSLVAILLSFGFSRRLTGPLKKLIQAINEMSKGSREVLVPDNDINEIKNLFTSFNEMSTTIENHENILKKEIDDATKSLSDKVKILEVMSSISQSVIENDLSKMDAIRINLLGMLNYFKVDKISIALYYKNDKGKIHIYLLTSQHQIKEEIIDYLNTPIHQVIEKNEPLIQDLSIEDEKFPRVKVLLKEGIKSTAMIPLMVKNKVIGTINFGKKELNYFNAEFINEVLLFTNQIAISLDRAEAHETLHESAYHDFLTNLPNYRYLREHLNRVLIHANESKHKLALLFIDIDRFKNINDSLGHNVGGLLLVEFSRKIVKELDPSITIARMGGDEFTILLPKIENPKDAEHLAEQILSLFNEPVMIEGYEIHVTLSIGIAIYPSDGKDGEALIKHADTAMYRVKENGKNNFTFYTPLKSDPSYDQLILENDLRKALERNEFEVYYQPKINIKEGKIAGLEALLRWRHPEKGFISPGRFIPLAEETGLIVGIGEFVIKTVAKQSIKWQEEGLPPIPIAVNLSTRQFLQSNLVSMVEETINETGIDSNLLELEITESMTMDITQAITILNNLKKLGVKISMDDFGTGYSSLNYLRQLPIDRLKIDRAFIQDIANNDNNAAIVSTIINMAKNLRLTVTAEGVETESEALYLQKNNCDEIQGFYFSHPMPASDFKERYEEIRDRVAHWSVSED